MNDNFKCIYKILQTLEKALDYEKFDTNEICSERLGISKSRWLKYMEMLAGAGFMPAKTGAELKLMFTYGGNSGIIKTQQTIVSATYSQIRKAF